MTNVERAQVIVQSIYALRQPPPHDHPDVIRHSKQPWRDLRNQTATARRLLLEQKRRRLNAINNAKND